MSMLRQAQFDIIFPTGRIGLVSTFKAFRIPSPRKPEKGIILYDII
jgi:hypothetical protein